MAQAAIQGDLDSLRMNSTVVVDATLAIPAPKVVTQSNETQADVIFTAVNVIKGPGDLKQFAVTFARGNGVVRAAPGERYILFLFPIRPGRAQHVPALQRPRYETFFGGIGPFKVEGGNIQLTWREQDGELRRYDGVNHSQMIAYLNGSGKRPVIDRRVTGKWLIQGMPGASFEFVADERALTGKVTGANGSANIRGQIDGNYMEFDVTDSASGRRVSFKGLVKGDDEIQLAYTGTLSIFGADAKRNLVAVRSSSPVK
jgi:hypothetical protein